MKKTDRKKSYVTVVIFVLLISILIGFAIDLAITYIDYIIYPKPNEYTQFVEKYSREYGVSEELIYAVIKVESGFDSSAVSNKGAVGLMQIMPSTFEWLSKDMFHEHLDVGMLYDPETNIKYGTYYLSRLYSRFEDWNTAIAAYNGGEGNVSDWLADKRYSDDGKKLKIEKIPDEFIETRNYVKKVSKALDKYKKIYENK